MSFNQILYLTSKNNKPLKFEIKVEIREGFPCLITTKGYTDGQQQQDVKPFFEGVNLGKSNETSPQQQAINEAQGIYNKLKDKGYKDNLKDLKSIKTDASGRPLIMKAQKDLNKIVFPCYIQRKYDGMRCIVSREQGIILFRSKYGKQLENLEHLEPELKFIKEGQELDGELYIHGKSLQSIISQVKTKSELNKEIHYRLYDELSEYDQTERIKRLRKYPKGKLVAFVPTPMVNDWEEAQEMFEQFIAEGYEGAILRNPNGLYEFGHRSYNLIKYKQFEEDEFEIVDVEQATGRDLGTGIFVCKTKEGKRFNARPRGTREERANYFKNKGKFIGKQLTVIYQKFTDYGIPFHPVGKIVRDYE